MLISGGSIPSLLCTGSMTQSLRQANGYSPMDCLGGRQPSLFISDSLLHSLVHGTTMLNECHCEVQGKGRLPLICACQLKNSQTRKQHVG